MSESVETLVTIESPRSVKLLRLTELYTKDSSKQKVKSKKLKVENLNVLKTKYEKDKINENRNLKIVG